MTGDSLSHKQEDVKIEIPKRHPAHSFKLWETPAMRKLVNLLPSNKFTYQVGLIPPGYYIKEPGCYGYEGPCSSIAEEEIPRCDEGSELLHITFTALLSFIDNLTGLDCKLSLTPGARGQKYKVLSFTEIYETKKLETPYGIYKKEGFDSAFTATKQLIPDLTEDNFAKFNIKKSLDTYAYDEMDVYNYDLVEKKQYGDDKNLIIKYSSEHIERKNTGTAEYTISILSTDIEKNLDILVECLREV